MPKKRQSQRPSSDEEQTPGKQRRASSPSPPPPPQPPSPLCFQSPDSLFQSLIQPLKMEHFFSEFWEKKPLLLQRSDPSTAAYYQTLFQLSDLLRLCSQGLHYCTDVNLVRCINGKKKVLNKQGRVKAAVLASSLTQNKTSIQFHQPQRFKDELWRIQEKLECFFGALVGSNVYITPEDSQGLPAHYDDVEVFILQLEGQKRWRLYSPTVRLAAEYSVESEDRIGSPTHDILLKTGDLLYFPRGTIHQAETPEGVSHSTHVTLSTYQRTSWGDLLLDSFPSLLSESSRTEVSLREGIPRRLLLDCSEGLHSSRTLAARLRSLADELEKGTQNIQSSHMKRDFIMNRLPPYCQQELLTPAGSAPSLEDSVCLTFRDHMVVTVEPSKQNTEDAAELVVLVLHCLKNQRERHMMDPICEEDQDWDNFRGLQFPLSHLEALRQLQRAERLTVAQLPLPTNPERLSLVLSLWSESLLHVV